ncbi:hypothetical protein V2J23_17690, partial [Geobacillus thermoleovorans]|uniref:hypothetical protein n=1 Tax=Geobacillus thermoleovorans TaxID=33941 RepID=UPI00345C3FD2
AIFSIPARIRSVYRTHQVVGIFTEKFYKSGKEATRWLLFFVFSIIELGFFFCVFNYSTVDE